MNANVFTQGRWMWFLIIPTMILPIALVYFDDLTPSIHANSTVLVPEDYSTIQAAIDAAADGDLVLVGPGTYNENLIIAGKSIILASHFHTTGDRNFTDQTIIDGQGSATITAASTAGPKTRISGFTIQNGEDGILASAHLEIDNNRIVGNGDGLDYENGGGPCHDNVFENNSDDAIDFDGHTGGSVENNIIQFNDDDGIEIRLHPYSGPPLTIIIRNNIIHGNGEDGIQLIDYSDVSDRIFYIERNRITNNAMVGLGLMDNGETREDFRAASIPERIHLFNNTFSGNPYAVTGGDNLIALNNLFINSSALALKNLDGGAAGSIAAFNLLWNNGSDSQGSNIDMSTSVFADPLLDGNYQLQPGSPAVDAGTADFTWNGETVLNIPPGDYGGSAPDLGWSEANSIPPTETNTPTPTATPSAIPTPAPCGCAESGRVTKIRTLFPSEWGVPHPAGLSYSLDRDHLALLTESGPDQPPAAGAAVVVITPLEDLVGTANLPFVADGAINMAFDDAGDHLLLLNNEQSRLAQVAVSEDGVPDPDSLIRSNINHLGLNHADGLDVDPDSRRLFILDSGASQVVSAGTANEFELVSKIDLCHLDAPDLRGVAVHPASHNLFIMSPSGELLYELTDSGQLLNTYDLATLELVDPHGLAFGPSTDLTDDPDTIHLFMADSNLPGDEPQPPGINKLYLPLVVQSIGDVLCGGRVHSTPAEAEQGFGRILEVLLSPSSSTPTNTPTTTATATPTITPTPTHTPTSSNNTVRFAVVGDYGDNNPNEARVATLVDDWTPDFVITTGDNNYPDGEAATIDDNIGQYYSRFIGNYQGSYGLGSSTNRFWPSLGNHDWDAISCTEHGCTGAYFDYFTLPNNERYYEVDLGFVTLFALDSDSDEPDGRNQNSVQADWLLNQLATSTACYNIVYFHHAAYSSGRHGSKTSMQWPFSAWGADAVLSGHDHLYERLDVSGTPYFVNGAGGASLYNFENLGNLPPEATSIIRYNQDYGAMLVTATSTGITYQFYNADNLLIDDHTVTKNCD